MKALVIRQHVGYVSIENSSGDRAQAPDVERALIAFAHKHGIEWSEGDIHSGFEAAQAIETMLGPEVGQGQIHDGVVSG